MGGKIAVLGSGANGSAIGADLTRAGLDVVLIDQWPAHVEAMRNAGLHIKLPEEELHVAVHAFHLCDIATFTEPFDVVLMLVKAYDTRWAAELIKPYLAENGLLVGVQNGMTAGTIAEVVGPARTLGCVIEVASEMYTPGRIQRHSPPDFGSWFGLGATDPANAGREPEIAAILGHAGAIGMSENILSAKWMKLVMNAMTLAPSALLGLPLDEAERVPGMRELMLRAGAEALAAGQAQGLEPEPIIGLKPDEVENTNRLLELLLEKLASITVPGTRTTILQDHMKGRLSETDGINGLVVAEHEKQGKAAPVNAAIADITQRIHAGELTPESANLDLLRAAMAE